MTPLRILLVEDEFVIANDLQGILQRRLGSDVFLAFAVPDALAHLDANRPDLVFVDIMLQGERSGIELGQLLRTRYRIPFIYVTSHADKLTLQRAVTTQPHGYILKPFKEAEIVAAVELAQVRSTNEQLTLEKAYLTEEIRATHNFQDLVGQDPATEALFEQVRQVAPYDMTTLLLGETGTGKELFARAIHAQSARHSYPLIKVNCAALPAQLIESELFGHEKGSYTGASERRLGKFELAHKGTIFLDEIGELPLELQPKLLRVLQEKEIERLGGSETLPVDVRVIAATNRDLPAEVAAGRFRADLYYRLNVFPITIPPLRERRGDIAPLAQFFLQKARQQLGKPVQDFSPEAWSEMQRYDWPGNVRELQHLVERAVLLARGPLITTLGVQPAASPAVAATTEPEFVPRSLEEMEREFIWATLRYCNGRIRGVGGAAELLQMHPNTLDARVRKLGIAKDIVLK
ncbi:sigma-54-dependent transcriptional regulator [Hymenobacter weizhouensis]|uniref:sigma-54-dependent transcriptional regulator n=1 Tax=Hymenobacter sp. YIM 151500-1 TaxID=2987689 RepID=UPI002226D31D|nr:sigma-54 dependent transcriptional regulator [Hymenobacter sp. YIM 151500-1]UYZ62042.1 sigma-54 dependent transcriptional regulator [Hymenobacter sp. YIM 151500-1]